MNEFRLSLNHHLFIHDDVINLLLILLLTQSSFSSFSMLLIQSFFDGHASLSSREKDSQGKDADWQHEIEEGGSVDGTRWRRGVMTL